MVSKGASGSKKVAVKQPTLKAKQDRAAVVVSSDLEKTTQQRIMQLLKEKPEQAPLVLHCLENDTLVRKETTRTHWSDHMSKLVQVPKVFLGDVLSQVQPLLTREILERLDALDKEVVRKLVCYAMGVDTWHWKLPRAALEKAVLARVLSQRYSAYGGRLRDSWVQKHVSHDVKKGLDWAQCGVYHLKPSEKAPGEAHALENINGDEHVFDEDIRLKAGAVISENWSDLRAHVRKGWLFSQGEFKDNKYVKASSAKVFEFECTAVAKKMATAAAEEAGPAAAAAASGSDAPSTIGQPCWKVRVPKTTPMGLSLMSL
jgi:hypothetical protein